MTHEENHGQLLLSKEIAALLSYSLITNWAEENLIFDHPKIKFFHQIITNSEQKRFHSESQMIDDSDPDFSVEKFIEEMDFYIQKSELGLIKPELAENNIFSFETYKELFLQRGL